MEYPTRLDFESRNLLYPPIATLFRGIQFNDLERTTPRRLPASRIPAIGGCSSILRQCSVFNSSQANRHLSFSRRNFSHASPAWASPPLDQYYLLACMSAQERQVCGSSMFAPASSVAFTGPHIRVATDGRAARASVQPTHCAALRTFSPFFTA